MPPANCRPGVGADEGDHSAATATAGPVSILQSGRSQSPKCWFSPLGPHANSNRWVLPARTAPAAVKVSTIRKSWREADEPQLEARRSHPQRPRILGDTLQRPGTGRRGKRSPRGFRVPEHGNRGRGADRGQAAFPSAAPRVLQHQACQSAKVIYDTLAKVLEAFCTFFDYLEAYSNYRLDSGKTCGWLRTRTPEGAVNEPLPQRPRSVSSTSRDSFRSNAPVFRAARRRSAGLQRDPTGPGGPWGDAAGPSSS